jgi:predicted permease
MFRKLSALFHRDRFEREMDTEFRSHREAYIDDLIAKGTPRADAEQRATREFGAALQFKDECRDARGLYWPDALARDLRYAARQLRKNPAFCFTAVLTLALCIGANTAIYSIVDAVLFRPLPYPQPDRLVQIIVHRQYAGGVYDQLGQDGRTWEALHPNVRAIDIAVQGSASGVNFVSQNAVQYVKQQRVSAGFFRVMGVPPLIGREFTPDEDRPAGPAVVILASNLWTTALHSDPNVVGRQITLRGEPFTVIGVMPEGFKTSTPADLWTPLRPSRNGEGGGINYELIARIASGATPAQASTEIASIGQGIVSTWHLKKGSTAVFQLMPLQRSLGDSLRRPLLILWAAVGLVLLIGCVNIAGLLLARAGMRGKEIATRMALGSGRAAVVRQLLAESLLLSIAGGISGIAIGFISLKGLIILSHGALGLWREPVLDTRVLLFTALLSFGVSLLFGLYPAIETTRVDIRGALAQGGNRGASGHHQSWQRRLLVVGEVALGVVLLIGAGLLIRTLAVLLGLEPGFDSHNVITASLSLQDARYANGSKVVRLYDETLDRISKIPGVESAAIGLTLPYQRALNSGFKRLDGPHPSKDFEISNTTYVTPGYFETLRVPLMRGRAFTASDRAETQPVAIVNRSFAAKSLPGQEPLGSSGRRSGAPRRLGRRRPHRRSPGDLHPSHAVRRQILPDDPHVVLAFLGCSFESAA